MTPLQGPALGAMAPGKREAGAERAEEKGNENAPVACATQGCNRAGRGPWGVTHTPPHLYSCVLGLGTVP